MGDFNWKRAMSGAAGTLQGIMARNEEEQRRAEMLGEQREYEDQKWKERLALQEESRIAQMRERDLLANPDVMIPERLQEFIPGSQGLGPSPTGRPMTPGMAPLRDVKAAAMFNPPAEAPEETYTYTVPDGEQIPGLTAGQYAQMYREYNPYVEKDAPAQTWEGPFGYEHKGLGPSAVDVERYSKMGHTPSAAGGWDYKDPQTGATEEGPPPASSFGTEGALKSYIGGLYGQDPGQKDVTLHPEADLMYRMSKGAFGEGGEPEVRSFPLSERSEGQYFSGMDVPPKGMISALNNAAREADLTGGLVGNEQAVTDKAAGPYFQKVLQGMMTDGVLDEEELAKLDKEWSGSISWSKVKKYVGDYGKKLDEYNLQSMFDMGGLEPAAGPQAGDAEFMSKYGF